MKDPRSEADPTTRVTSLTPVPPPFTRRGKNAVLLVVGGVDVGRIAMVAGAPVAIGTGEGCGLVLTDPTVSRRHLEARWDGRALQLVDLGSKNGSFVGSKRFDVTSVALGDDFVAGKTVVRVLPQEETLEPPPLENHTFGGLVGASEAMRRLFAILAQVSPTSSAVLIEGETGVGKERVADEIHRRSLRRDGPFIVFDCGAVPDHLLEATLFGHVRGAFTGATAERIGVFDEADGGTLFLDEIGELDVALQPALLRALDRGEIRPVGQTRYHKVDVRVVAATNRNLATMIRERTFREDLYYRLAVLRISVAPLRERPEDLPLLVRHFLSRLGRPDVVVARKVLDELAARRWPGNVRELRNVLERSLTLARGGPLSLTPEPAAAAAEPPARPRARRAGPFGDAKAKAIAEFEKGYLAELISAHPTLHEAARVSQMDRKHLRTLLRRYGHRAR